VFELDYVLGYLFLQNRKIGRLIVLPIVLNIIIFVYNLNINNMHSLEIQKRFKL
jgi:hypothetical protein